MFLLTEFNLKPELVVASGADPYKFFYEVEFENLSIKTVADTLRLSMAT
jgi:hypothetical protein